MSLSVRGQAMSASLSLYAPTLSVFALETIDGTSDLQRIDDWVSPRRRIILHEYKYKCNNLETFPCI